MNENERESRGTGERMIILNMRYLFCIMNAPRQPVVKKSYGIILCRKNTITHKWEVLAIKKRNTYAFVEFILNKHNRKEERKILALLNRMTYDEKVDILSLDFGHIWHRFQLFNPDSNVHKSHTGGGMKISIEDFEKYKSRKASFERTFMSDRGRLLRRLIANSHNSINNWEIPKGRKNGPEKTLNCAIRETAEETGLYPTQYDILLDESPLRLVQITPNARYESYYYIAVMNDHKLDPRPPERIKAGCPSEVAEIQWLTLEKISVVDHNGKLTRLIDDALKIVRCKYGYDRLLRYDYI